jgi:hypothetical protein
MLPAMSSDNCKQTLPAPRDMTQGRSILGGNHFWGFSMLVVNSDSLYCNSNWCTIPMCPCRKNPMSTAAFGATLALIIDISQCV